ncbi:Hpt domain-containing protein [Achromobacter aegrifaciens]|uniref:Hpt domain-containing protein n=1 Tax=Achromobacter aegrifaciens TaxID=1287736 RepID=UPI0028A756C9|nr:Hpt domain-containing protein [Achromobacter aegrifaciens]
MAQGPLPARVHEALTRSLHQSLAAIRKELAAIRTGNAPAEPEAGAHLHSLRGAYAMIHETALADRCAQMEDLARNRRTDALAEALDVFEPMALAALAGRHPRDAEK